MQAQQQEQPQCALQRGEGEAVDCCMMMAVMSVMVAPPSPNKIIIIKCSPTKTIQPTCREENGAKVQLFEEELQPDEQMPPFLYNDNNDDDNCDT